MFPFLPISHFLLHRLCGKKLSSTPDLKVYLFETGYYNVQTDDGISVIHTSAAGQSEIDSDTRKHFIMKF